MRQRVQHTRHAQREGQVKKRLAPGAQQRGCAKTEHAHQAHLQQVPDAAIDDSVHQQKILLECSLRGHICCFAVGPQEIGASRRQNGRPARPDDGVGHTARGKNPAPRRLHLFVKIEHRRHQQQVVAPDVGDHAPAEKLRLGGFKAAENQGRVGKSLKMEAHRKSQQHVAGKGQKAGEDGQEADGLDVMFHA